MDLLTQRLLMTAGSGQSDTGPVYVEDVFSSDPYRGTGSSLAIVNNIDLSGKGGMIWFKNRYSDSTNHVILDTVRGKTNRIIWNGDTPPVEATDDSSLTSFNNNGFTLAADSGSIASANKLNATNAWYVALTFRVQRGFFDIVTWDGTATADDTSERTINHNLDSVPGMIIVVDRSVSGQRIVYHRGSTGNTTVTTFNTDDQLTDTRYFRDTTPTSTNFKIGSKLNTTSKSYVAYLFAHNDARFGDNSDQSIIKCDDFDSDPVDVDLGWDAQTIVLLPNSNPYRWIIFDANLKASSKRTGTATYLYNDYFYPSLDNDAYTSGSLGLNLKFTTDFGSNGFHNYGFSTTDNHFLAIRGRSGSHMRPESDATKLFAMDTGTTSAYPGFDAGFKVDIFLSKKTGATQAPRLSARFVSHWFIFTNLDVDSSHNTTQARFDSTTGVGYSTSSTYISALFQTWMWRRYKGIDFTYYKGSGSAQSINHQLGNTVEMLWIKKDADDQDWAVYHKDMASDANERILSLNNNWSISGGTSAGYWNNTTPTSTVFTIGTDDYVNTSGSYYFAFLMSSVAGISKCGGYSGSTSAVTVTVGFRCRFLMVKNCTSATDWRVYDSLRGIGTEGSDKYFRLNLANAQVLNDDTITLSDTQFTISASAPDDLNENGSQFIYWAHA